MANEQEGRPMRKLTLYRDDSTTQVVFDNVKHFFWTAGNSTLTIAQYTDIETGEHRYIHWPRERFCWFRDEAMSLDFSKAEVGKYLGKIRKEGQ